MAEQKTARGNDMTDNVENPSAIGGQQKDVAHPGL